MFSHARSWFGLQVGGRPWLATVDGAPRPLSRVGHAARRALLVLAFWLGMGSPMSFAAPSASARDLSLAEALAQAETESTLVRRAARERQEIAAREVGASLWLPSNPSVGVVSGVRRDPSYTPSQGTPFDLRVEQTVELGGQRGARREVVRQSVRAAGLREEVARLEVRARVRGAYVSSSVATEQVALAQRRAALAQQLVEAADTRATAGAGSDVERGLARLERGRARRALLEAELQAAGALGVLRALLGLPAQQALRLSTALGAPPSPPAGLDLAGLLERAHERRRELAVLEASQSELDAELVRLGREAIPSPTLLFDVGRDLPGQTFLTAGLSVPLPVFRRYQGEKAIVRAAQGRLLDERVLLGREIDAEVAAAARILSARSAELSLLETETIPAGDASVDLVTEGWRAGKFDLFRVIQVSREAAEARASRLEVLAALWEASIGLDRAVGGL